MSDDRLHLILDILDHSFPYNILPRVRLLLEEKKKNKSYESESVKIYSDLVHFDTSYIGCSLEYVLSMAQDFSNLTNN